MKRKSKYPFPLVEIRWWDAQTDHGWEDKIDILVNVPEVITVGFLITENESGAVLASTVGDDMQSNARITIPAGMIQGRKVLA